MRAGLTGRAAPSRTPAAPKATGTANVPHTAGCDRRSRHDSARPSTLWHLKRMIDGIHLPRAVADAGREGEAKGEQAAERMRSVPSMG